MNPTDIAIFFNISAREINKIFAELQWARKEGRWWIATELGKEKGAKENYDYKRKVKFIKWDSNIKTNLELIEKIKKLKEKKEPIIEEIMQPINEEIKPKNTKKMTKKEKKEKGDLYEAYIANHFKEQDYYVWEHGKEKGVLDGGIDLLLKKDKEIYFVQCKNWETWKINDKAVKATQTDVRNYLKKEKLLWELIKDYNAKILYITPHECLTKGAYTYIKENSEIVEYQIIEMK